MTNPTDYDYNLYYSEWHAATADHLHEMGRYLSSQLAQFLPSPSAESVIDIGSGMGFAVQALRSLGFPNVTAIDIDESQVKAAASIGINVELVSDTVAFLRARPESYGVALALDVLEHVPVDSQIEFMRAVHESLMPGGRVLVQVPNANSVVAARYRYGDFTHYSSFTEHSIRFVMRNAGFTNIEIAIEGHPGPRPTFRLWQYLDSRVRRRLRQWLLRYLWREMLRMELGSMVDNAPLAANMMVVAYKDSNSFNSASSESA